MSFYFEQAQRPSRESFAAGAAEGGDIFTAAWRATQYAENANSAFLARAEAYRELIGEVEAATGTLLDNPMTEADRSWLERMETPQAPFSETMPRETHDQMIAGFETRFAAQLAELRETHPEAEFGADIDTRTHEVVAGSEEEFFRLMGSSPGWDSYAMSFLGAATASLNDPVQLGSLFLGAGGVGRTAAMRILTTVAGEALVNAGVEAAIQPAVQAWRAKHGLEAGFDVGLRNVLFAGAFGGLLGGVGRGAYEAIAAAVRPRLSAQARAAIDGDANAAAAMLDEIRPALAPEVRGALDQANADAAIDAQLAPVGDAAAEQAAVAEARAQVARGEPVNVTPPQAQPRLDTAGTFSFFNPASLEVDAGRFQFKAGGDAAGVTDRLEGVQAWQAERAGVIVVWEDAGGRRFVADGHQRVGLARRVQEAGGDEIEMPGYLFRERDGFTAEDVRTISALKNIAEGSGSALDAAKVLRTGEGGRSALAPGGLAETGLPPNSALVRDAAGLAKLSDDAFTMAVNEVIDTRFAALVGRAVANPKLHAQMLEVLARERPASIAEADSMIRDLQAATTVRETTIDLFGEAETERMLLKERAQVRGAAVNALKRDKKVFAMLADEESRVASAGNVLDTAANRTRADEDTLLIEAIDKLSNRRGPVADAFNTAARAVAGGERAAGAARAFVDAVRAEIERAGGNLGRIGDEGPDAPLKLDGETVPPRAEEPIPEPDGLDDPAKPEPGLFGAPLSPSRREAGAPSGDAAPADPFADFADLSDDEMIPLGDRIVSVADAREELKRLGNLELVVRACKT